jgi:2-dehydro-3-deoxygalactonokinase
MITTMENPSSIASQPSFIGFDWGTSSLRAYLINADGKVVDRRQSSDGILKPQNFRDTVSNLCESWDKAYGTLDCIASGMIGSKQGWCDAGYVDAPANFRSLATQLKDISNLAGRRFLLVPGVKQSDPLDVMRGEETQVFGTMYFDQTDRRIAVLPGTHSKWVQTDKGAILNFKTYMTGETFALFRQHSILAKLMPQQAQTEFFVNAFTQGVRLAKASPGNLLANVFSARTLGLFNELPPQALPDYLSGMLVGHEIASALTEFSGRLTLIGDDALIARYSQALKVFDAEHQLVDNNKPVAATGLFHFYQRSQRLGF